MIIDENDAVSIPGFTVGDLITSYHKGYHRIVKIQRRFLEERDLKYVKGGKLGDEHGALISYVTICTSTGKLVNSKTIGACDERFCVPARQHLNEELKKLLELKKTLFPEKE